MKRLVAFIAASAGVLLANPVLAQTENCGAELNYDDADIRAVIDEIAVRTGRTFLLDPRVQGRVTVKSPPNGGLCPDEAWELFQAMLRVNGFAATPLGASKYKIVPLQESARAAGPVGEGATGGDLVTQIVRLRFIDAREAAANLSQIINERGVAAPVRSGNSIILVDTADNVERLKAVLAQLDRDPTVYKTIQLANASAAEVARVLKGLAREISEEGGAQSVPVSIVPVEASNSILLRAEPAMIQRLAGVISELDQIGGAKADLSVIPLSHANAEEIAQTLSQFMGPQTAGGDNPDAPPQQSATVSFHRPTNSIIINGDADMQRKMQWLISQLDVRRAQVLIEAIVVEVSDSTARELGLQYFLTGTKGSSIPFATTNFQNVSPNILALAGPTLIETGNFPGSVSDDLKDDITEAALTELLGISGLAFGGAGTIGDDGVFSAILTALKQDERSNVLSSPSIVTVDNQEAELSVGQEIPITTGEAVGDNLTNAFRTIERKEVGVILTVTPQINEGGTIARAISQEISSVAGQIISSSTDLITNKRRITTTALVDDGDILVIGGLIDEQSFRREEKVPILGDIPYAGNLFKSSGRMKERRNLMVFLRPTIIRDKATAQAATKKKFDYLRAKELLRTGEAQTDLERLIEQVTGIAEPTENTEPSKKQ